MTYCVEEDHLAFCKREFHDDLQAQVEMTDIELQVQYTSLCETKKGVIRFG
jgi:hypothetical protein